MKFNTVFPMLILLAFGLNASRSDAQLIKAELKERPIKWILEKIGAVDERIDKAKARKAAMNSFGKLTQDKSDLEKLLTTWDDLNKRLDELLNKRVDDAWEKADFETRSWAKAESAELRDNIRNDTELSEEEESIPPRCKPHDWDIAKKAGCYCMVRYYASGQPPEARILAQYMEALVVKVSMDCFTKSMLARAEKTSDRVAKCLERPVSNINKYLVNAIAPTPPDKTISTSVEDKKNKALVLLHEFCRGS